MGQVLSRMVHARFKCDDLQRPVANSGIRAASMCFVPDHFCVHTAVADAQLMLLTCMTRACVQELMGQRRACCQHRCCAEL